MNKQALTQWHDYICMCCDYFISRVPELLYRKQGQSFRETPKSLASAGWKLWPLPHVEEQSKSGAKLVLVEGTEPGRTPLAAHCCSGALPFYT